MNHKTKTLINVKCYELKQVVHPKVLEAYELSSGMEVLVVDGLPQTDSVIDPLNMIRKDLPFLIKSTLKAKSDTTTLITKPARYQVKEPDTISSVFSLLPPLSASVVEYKKKHSPKVIEKFYLAWMQVEETKTTKYQQRSPRSEPPLCSARSNG